MARKRSRKIQGTSAQLSQLDELKQIAKQLGVVVRQEKLLREAGYRVRSGQCRVNEENVVILDRSLPASAQIDLLAEALVGYNLEEIEMSPKVQRLLTPVAVASTEEA